PGVRDTLGHVPRNKCARADVRRHREPRSSSTICEAPGLTRASAEYVVRASVEIGPRADRADRSHRNQSRDRLPMAGHLKDLAVCDAAHHLLQVLLELADGDARSLLHL